jgi:hypothetical protein
MKKMTCNQAMVLMDIYRDTFQPDNHMGTCPVDLRRLEAGGLILKKLVWHTTPAGDKKVKEMLG